MIVQSKKQITKTFDYLIQDLKCLYEPTHKQLHYRELTWMFSENYPQLIIKDQMIQKQNVFSLIYYQQSDIEECCFEAITKTKIQQFNTKILQYTRKDSQITEKILVREIFEREGVNCDDKDQFKKNVSAKIKQYYLLDADKSNRVSSLMKFYIQIEAKSHVFLIIYNLPFGFCKNQMDLYIDQQRMVFSFYTQAYQQIFKTQKFKIRKISQILGISQKFMKIQKTDFQIDLQQFTLSYFFKFLYRVSTFADFFFHVFFQIVSICFYMII